MTLRDWMKVGFDAVCEFAYDWWFYIIAAAAAVILTVNVKRIIADIRNGDREKLNIHIRDLVRQFVILALATAAAVIFLYIAVPEALTGFLNPLNK